MSSASPPHGELERPPHGELERPPDGEPERLHPLFLLTGLGGSLRGLLGGYAFIGYLAVSGSLSTALLMLVALVTFMALSILIYWRRFEYRVGASDIRIDSGILSRTHRSIPFERIQDVDISQGIAQRLFGLARVKFETGGSSGAGEDEGVLQAISMERAQQLRALVRSHRAPTAETAALSADPALETEAAEPVFAMDHRRLGLAGLFNFSLALFAGLIGATQTFGDVLGFDPMKRAFWLQLLSAGDPIADFLLAHRVVAAIGGLAVLIVIGLATGIVRTVLREFGFRLDRTDVGLRRRRGLLTRTDVTLPARRAQAAIIGSGLVRSRFGWRELKLQSLAQDEGGNHVLAPLATAGEVDLILHELGWRPLPANPAWQHVSRAYIWTFALRLSPLLLLFALLTALFGFSPLMIGESGRALVARELAPMLIFSVGGLVVLALAIAGRAFGWRRTGFLLDDDRLLVRSGWWCRRMLVLPIGRIQSIDLAQSLLGRWFGIAGLVFGVAGGSSVHAIPALPQDNARTLRNRLLQPNP
jgi:putative membrane protein